MEKIKSAEAQRRREGAPVAQSRGRTLREPNRPSVQEGSAPGGRGREPQRPRGGHGLGVSVHASLAGRQGLGAECQGGLWTLTGTELGAVRGGRSTRPHPGGTGPRGRGVEKGRGWGGH